MRRRGASLVRKEEVIGKGKGEGFSILLYIFLFLFLFLFFSVYDLGGRGFFEVHDEIFIDTYSVMMIHEVYTTIRV